MLRRLVNYIRGFSCEHDFDKYSIEHPEAERPHITVLYICKKCGYSVKRKY
jgi:rubrerythrin